MTIYNVYIHRDIRLTFEGVEAQTPEFALRIARDGLTSDADDIDESGEDLSASVEVDGDEDHGRSLTIDFEAERQRKTAPKLLAALIDLVGDRDINEQGNCHHCGREYPGENLIFCPAD